MKNNLKLSLLILSCSSLFIYGCTYYKTMPLPVVSESKLNTYSIYKPNVTIEKNETNEVFLLKNFEVRHDTIYGNLIRSEYLCHAPNRNTFRDKKGNQPLRSLHLYTNRYMESGTSIKFSLSDITMATVHENAPGASFFSSACLGGATVIGGFIGLLFIACNCPHVESITPNGTTTFQGSLFPGAMYKMLERNDYLMLNGIKANEGELLEFKVFNNLQEVQHIDNVNLIEVRHHKDFLGIDQQSQLIAFNKGIAPFKAMSKGGVNLLEKISNQDELRYEFEDAGDEDTLNSIELTFNASILNDNVQLVISGRQSKQLEKTAEYFFQQFGKSFSKYTNYKNKDNAKKYADKSIEQGISMNVYLKVNDIWKYVGSYANVGTVADRISTLPINLKGLSGNVSIKLESAHKFWTLDQVSLTSDWTSELETIQLPLVSAINQDGNDVSKMIIKTDKNYVTNKDSGTYVNLKYSVLSKITGTLVLQSSGYYNHSRHYDTKPNLAVLRELNKTKYGFHSISRLMSLQSQLLQAKN